MNHVRRRNRICRSLSYSGSCHRFWRWISDVICHTKKLIYIGTYWADYRKAVIWQRVLISTIRISTYTISSNVSSFCFLIEFARGWLLIGLVLDCYINYHWDSDTTRSWCNYSVYHGYYMNCKWNCAPEQELLIWTQLRRMTKEVVSLQRYAMYLLCLSIADLNFCLNVIKYPEMSSSNDLPLY